MRWVLTCVCVHARMDWSWALIDGDDDNDENSAQEQERRARRCVGYRGARNGEYVQSRNSEEQTKRCVRMYVCVLNRLTLHQPSFSGTVLPKQGSVFAFAVPLYSTEPGGSGGSSAQRMETVLDGPHIEIEVYGNQFCFRAADRAGRKFKHKETIEL